MSDSHQPLAPDHANVVAFPPAVFLGSFVLGFLLQRLLPAVTWPASRLFGAAGLTLAALGLGLLAWAALTMRRAKTAIYPGHSTTTIVTGGPYRYTRNPMYLGLTSAYVGVALVANWAWPLVTLGPALIVVRYGIIGREEAYLSAKFGNAFVEYMQRVPRWILLVAASAGRW